MSDQTAANPAEAGSDSVNTSLTLDEAVHLDFDEADEATSEKQEEAIDQGTDDTDGVEDQPEGEEAETSEEAGEEAEGEDKPEVAFDDDTLISLQDGEQLPLKELKLGYLREKDYRHKTQDIGNRRRDLEALNSRVTGTVEALTDFLAARLPEEPDASLAMTNPAEYLQKKVIFESALGQIQEIMQAGAAPRQVGDQLSHEQHQELLQQEDAKLVEALPFIADPQKRAEFNQQIFDTAHSLGFTADELKNSTDHRFIVLGHYARLGMQAEKAKEKAAKKITSVPPVTPNAQRGNRAGDATYRANKEALTRLNKTGSIKDALKIDFE